MWDIIPGNVRNFIDSLFAPVLSFLQLLRDVLNDVGSVVGKGINLNNYFSFFGYLPQEWQMVVQSALASITLIALLFLVRSIWNVYLKTKESIKFW